MIFTKTKQEHRNDANKRYYYRNKDKILEKARVGSKEVYEKTKEIRLESAKRSREANYEKCIYRNARSRCKLNGIDFTIELEDIIIPEYCPYLNTPITRTQGKGRVWTNASIDRIDPTKGYVKGNIQIISCKANLMKAHASNEELILFAKNILEIKDFVQDV